MNVGSDILARSKREKFFKEADREREKELERARKPYKASPWARKMINQIHDSRGRLGGVALAELEKRGVKLTKVKPKAPEGFDPNKGGFGEPG